MRPSAVDHNGGPPASSELPKIHTKRRKSPSELRRDARRAAEHREKPSIDTLAARRNEAWAGKSDRHVGHLAEQLGEAFAEKRAEPSDARDGQPFEGHTTPFDRWTAPPKRRAS
jgi:hypothetical protein